MESKKDDGFVGIKAEHFNHLKGYMVIEIDQSHEEWVQHKLVPKLREADLRCQLFTSNRLGKNGKPVSIFCKVYASVARLMVEADNCDLKLLLDRTKLKEADVKRNTYLRDVEKMSFYPPKKYYPESAPRDDLSIPRKRNTHDPYDYIYAPFDIPSKPSEAATFELFYEHKRTGCVLSPTDILCMLLHAVENPQGGAGMDMDQLKNENVIKTFYFLHDEEERGKLETEMLKWDSMPWQIPVERIRNYFGEKVAMYFSFLGLSTTWLLFPTILGIALFIHQESAKHISVIWVPIFGILIAIWITLFLEAWKREQSALAMQWGTSDYEEMESLRPEFMTSRTATMVRSTVHGKPEFQYSESAAAWKIFISSGLITTCAGIVIVVVLSIFSLQIILVKKYSSAGGILASIINALQIQIMNLLYTKLALALNDWENHRTDTDYEDALITKVAIFQFINSYIALFYVAFIKGSFTVFGQVTHCEQFDCLAELRQRLATIFATRLVVGNITEVGVPWIKVHLGKLARGCLKACCSRYKPLEEPVLTATEKESLLSSYDTFDDYLEMLIQFGYATLFVVAFPLAPLFALVNNYFEIRVDSFKILRNSCRGVPERAQDIGTWYIFLQAMGFIAVFTNVGVVVFTGSGTFFNTTNPLLKLVAFVLVEHIVFGLKMLLNFVIPDQSGATKFQLKRQEYLVNKHIRHIQDEVINYDGPHMTINPAHAMATPLSPHSLSTPILPSEEMAKAHAEAQEGASVEGATGGKKRPLLTKKQQQQAVSESFARSAGIPPV